MESAARGLSINLTTFQGVFLLNQTNHVLSPPPLRAAMVSGSCYSALPDLDVQFVVASLLADNNGNNNETREALAPFANGSWRSLNTSSQIPSCHKALQVIHGSYCTSYRANSSSSRLSFVSFNLSTTGIVYSAVELNQWDIASLSGSLSHPLVQLDQTLVLDPHAVVRGLESLLVNWLGWPNYNTSTTTMGEDFVSIEVENGEVTKIMMNPSCDQLTDSSCPRSLTLDLSSCDASVVAFFTAPPPADAQVLQWCFVDPAASYGNLTLQPVNPSSISLAWNQNPLLSLTLPLSQWVLPTAPSVPLLVFSKLAVAVAMTKLFATFSTHSSIPLTVRTPLNLYPMCSQQVTPAMTTESGPAAMCGFSTNPSIVVDRSVTFWMAYGANSFPQASLIQRPLDGSATYRELSTTVWSGTSPFVALMDTSTHKQQPLRCKN